MRPTLVSLVTLLAFGCDRFSCAARTPRLGDGRVGAADTPDLGPDGPDGVGVTDVPACAQRCDGIECGHDRCGTFCGACRELSPHEDCVEGRCVASPCTPSCVGKLCGDDGCGGSCGECDWTTGFECIEGHCDRFACPGSFCPCVINDDCSGGVCAPTAEGTFCTPVCIATCPEPLVCAPFRFIGSDMTTACLDLHRSLCGPCSEDDDCGAGLGRCVSFGVAGSFCASPCDGSAPCPAGYACTNGLCLSVAPACGKLGPCETGTACAETADCPAGAACNTLREPPACQTLACGTHGVPCDPTAPAGFCAEGFACTGSPPTCTCTPDCDGKACGSDGCGGSCGLCQDGFGRCNEGQCAPCPGALGCPCTGDSACEPAGCGASGAGDRCGYPLACSPEVGCPPLLRCDPVPGAGETAYACVYEHASLCRRCGSHFQQCAPAVCTEVDGKRCLTACNLPDKPCPTGYGCEGGLCRPLSGACAP